MSVTSILLEAGPCIDGQPAKLQVVSTATADGRATPWASSSLVVLHSCWVESTRLLVSWSAVEAGVGGYGTMGTSTREDPVGTEKRGERRGLAASARLPALPATR